MNLTKAFVALSSLIFLTEARQSFVSRAAQDVWAPKVIQPDASTVWIVGKSEEVIWSLSDEPVNITNTQGRILLRHCVKSCEDDSEEDQFLGPDFDIRQGTQNVTVPVVEPGRYRITLFGDSGNYSPVFRIQFDMLD